MDLTPKPPAIQPPPPEGAWPPRQAPASIRAATSSVLTDPVERQRYLQSEQQFAAAGVRDYEFSTSFHDCRPDAVFDRLRWGGQLVFCSPHAREVDTLLDFYRQLPEWVIEAESMVIPRPRLGRWAGPLGRWTDRPLRGGVVRKILLDPISRLTARHSYDVRLIRAVGKVDQRYATDGYVVLKRVPSLKQATERLRQTVPGMQPARLGEIASKLVRKVFPVFLTREAAFLKLLQRDLPADLKPLTPRVLSMQTDDRGLVRAMSLTWLRQGGPTLSQAEFARHSARLLRALHERVGIMHLDLRLDNLLVTEGRVSLVDFGSSVRLSENLGTNPMVKRLVDEMLSASQITRDLRRQRKKRLLRNRLFADLPLPPTPAFDLYALTTNLTRPHDNPDLKGLIEHDRMSDEGRYFSQLRRRVLQPHAREKPIATLGDLCAELGVDDETPTTPPGPKPVILTGPMMPRRVRAQPHVSPQAGSA
jgi:hypothetical protein